MTFLLVSPSTITMLAFQLQLLFIFVALTGYSAIVIRDHGFWVLFSIFFEDMAKYEWPGQFNTDFMFMLMLSATWTAWRNNFTPVAFVLSFFAFFGGSMFLSVYLLALTFQVKDGIELLVGSARASRIKAN